MPQFDFQYNIKDIVSFGVQNDEGTCGETLRGTIRGILVSEDKYGYMIESCKGTEYIESSRVVQPVYSSKCFDVMYPNLEVEYRPCNDPAMFINAKIICGIITNGRLFYQISDENGREYLAEEGRVFLIQSDENREQFK